MSKASEQPQQEGNAAPAGTREPLVLLASARQESDTQLLVHQLLAGQSYKVINLLEHTISPYSYTGKYTAGDQFLSIAGQMLPHQRILFATPVYWYAMSGLLKTFFDRLTDLVTVEKKTGRQLAGKEVYLVAVGAEPDLPPGFEEPFKLTAAYFDMTYGGAYYCTTRQLQQDMLPKAAAFVEKVYR